jgi:DNA (cytosine-5)-methyltransferase 1
MTGGNRQPMIIENETLKIKQATKQGYIECKNGGVADFSFPDSKLRRGRVQGNGDICPTLMAGNNGIVKIEKVGQISNEGSQCGTVVSPNGLYPTISTGCHGYANPHIVENIRIRKLTPRECWRLMGFTDTDFEAAEKVNSNTQLYKQAGNSIVKNVLMAIFKQMVG